MNRTLLLPCAGKSSRYPGVRPKWMLTLPEGNLALARAAASVDPNAFGRLIATIRREHEQRYDASSLLKRVFGAVIEVVVLDHDTRGPAETVAETIERACVTGPIAVKDADSFFEPLTLPDSGFVALSDVRSSPQMSNVGAKSFAIINDQGLVVEMVEKTLASNYVSTGLYGFPDAVQYLQSFRAASQENASGEIFVAHVMNRAIAGGTVVKPLFVSELIDVGTLEDWRRYTRSRGSIIADIDGVVFRNHSRYFSPFWDEDDIPIEDNVEALRACQNRGAQLIFVTARPEFYREKTDKALRRLGLVPHAIVMDCRHGRRFLINDHAASNPYPSAVAISVERNAGNLEDYLKDWS